MWFICEALYWSLNDREKYKDALEKDYTGPTTQTAPDSSKHVHLADVGLTAVYC